MPLPLIAFAVAVKATETAVAARLLPANFLLLLIHRIFIVVTHRRIPDLESLNEEPNI